MLKKIAELVQAQSHCVLATCAQDGEGCAPHASLMSYCPSPDGLEFWMATLRDTRKHANLSANPRASLLFDDRTTISAGGEPGNATGAPSLALTVHVELRPFANAAAEVAARQGLLARRPELASFLALDGALLLRFVGLRYQLLSGLTEASTWLPEEKS